MSGTAMLAGAAGMETPATAMQAEKYSAPINVTTGTVTIRATATFSDGSSADRLYRVTRDSDSDGDGIPDESWLRIACSGGAVMSAWEYEGTAPRVVATGQSSGKGTADGHSAAVAGGIAGGAIAGKLQHKPFTITKQWDRTAIIGQRVSWDLEQGTSAGLATDDKTMGADSWHRRTLRDGAANLCV
ncbi:MAG: hypothetical protein ABIO80_06150 [Sphingomicrobium sp.]